MALNFGGGGLFNAKDDGAVVLQNQFARTSTPPILDTIGQVVFWERGYGVFDSYNSSIDATKWTVTQALNGSAGEGATTIWAHAGVAGTWPNTSWCKLTTIGILYANISEIEFQATVKAADVTGVCTSTSYVKVFGLTLITKTNGASDTSTWKLTKNLDNTWNIYDDGVLSAENQTPTANNAEFYASTYNDFPGSITDNGRVTVYTISIDGGTYMMVRNSTKTIQILLDAI